MLEHFEESATRYLELLEANEKQDVREDDEKTVSLKEKLERAQNRIKELEKMAEEIEKNGEISVTDPDARHMSVSNNGTDISHNVQIAVDDQYHLVVAVDVVSTPADQQQLHGMAKQAMEEMGVELSEQNDGLLVKGRDELLPIKLKTMPFPGFPTDMQPQMMALMTKIPGESFVTETVFENRFKHVDELMRMNADITIDGRSAQVRGGKTLTGAPVKSSDLRAGASLVLAGLTAEGTTEISDIFHIDRGYYNFVERLQGLGAQIWRNNEYLKKAVNNS